jgi:protein phosphatase
MIKVKEFTSFSEIGKRSNNEDNYGFIEGSTFIVCDGVGGAEKGEIASEIVVDSFLNLYKADIYTPAQVAVEKAEQSLTEYMSQHPDSHGMATTLTLAQVRPGGMYIAWVGDSRVYQFRQGQIVFQTRDHSWVNEAVDAGILTPEEAVGHPKGNVITRAIQGEYKPVQAQDKFLPNVHTGDFFLLCSDGVLEAWSDEDLAALFGQAQSMDELQTALVKDCAIQSRDNHTAIILQVESGSSNEFSNSVKSGESQVRLMEAIPVSSAELNSYSKFSVSSKIPFVFRDKRVIGAMLAIVLIVILWITFAKEETDEKKPQQATEQQVQQESDESGKNENADKEHKDEKVESVEEKK